MAIAHSARTASAREWSDALLCDELSLRDMSSPDASSNFRIVDSQLNHDAHPSSPAQLVPSFHVEAAQIPCSMLIKHQQYDLLGRNTLERAVFNGSLRLKHAFSMEACFYCCISGKSTLIAPTETLDIKPMHGVLLRCGNYIGEIQSEADRPFEIIIIHFSPEVLELVFKDGFPEALMQAAEASPKAPQFAEVELSQLIENYVQGLLYYFNHSRLINDDLIALKIKELLLLLVDEASGSAEAVKTVIQNLFNPREASLKEVVQKHLFEQVSIDEMANLTNMSPSTFRRRFREIYGEPPAKYLRLQRLQKAYSLLSSDLRIKEICYEAGFNDVTSFTKLFTAHFGQSPTQFRKLEAE